MAVFDSSAMKYTVVFKNGDVTLQTSTVGYGVKPVYSRSVPIKAETDSCTYVFSGWSPELKPVDGNITYTAQYETVKKTFVVRFRNRTNNRYVLLEMDSVAYGRTPEYTGEIPTKKSSTNYTYEFAGWSPKLGPITQDMEYTALFDSTKITGIADSRLTNLELSVNVYARTIQISAAPVGSIYAILDMQGRILQKGRVESANFNIAVSQSGSYLVRIGKQTKRIDIK
jgi:hypothetical protein